MIVTIWVFTEQSRFLGRQGEEYHWLVEFFHNPQALRGSKQFNTLSNMYISSVNVVLHWKLYKQQKSY